MSSPGGAPAPPAAGIPPGAGDSAGKRLRPREAKAIFPLELLGCSIPRDAGAASLHKFTQLVLVVCLVFAFFFFLGVDLMVVKKKI